MNVRVPTIAPANTAQVKEAKGAIQRILAIDHRRQYFIRLLRGEAI